VEDPALPVLPEREDRGDDETTLKQLERELAQTREELHNTIEELESSNEELKTSNEEIMSMNEELQSLNEELNTVNNELREKIQEIEAVNNHQANLINSTHVAAIFLDRDLRVDFFSPAATDLFRLIPGDVGRPLSDISQRYEEPGLAAVCQTVLGTLEPDRREVINDEGRWFARRVTPFRTQDDRIEGVVISFHEVTAVKRREEELALSRERYALAQAAADLGNWDWVPEEGSLYWSDRVAPLLGLPPDTEPSFEAFMNCLHPRDREPTRQAIDHCLTGHGRMERDCRVVCPDGSAKWVHICAALATTGPEEPKRMVGLIMDITRRMEDAERLRQTVEELRESRDALEEANRRLTDSLEQQKRLEEERLRVLAGGVAHDFNNILMAVMGHTELAIDLLPPSSPAAKHLTESMRASEWAAGLANQMLLYSGKAIFAFQTLDLAEAMRTQSDLIKASVSGQASLSMTVPEEPLHVVGDKTQIWQVCMNLVTNAMEAAADTDKRCTISVEVGRDTPASLLSADGVAQGEDLSDQAEVAFIRVDDDAGGMPPDVAARVFEPFFSTRFQGRGLGLALVAGVAEAHGGMVHVESEPGSGTAATVLLPLAEQPAETEDAPDQPSPPTSEPVLRGTLLIVDDEPGVRTVVRTAMERRGLDVIEAGDGAEGVDRFREHAGNLLAVLLDRTMPGPDWRDVMSWMRTIDPSVPVIVASGYAPTEEDAASSYAPDAFLQKPYRARRVVELIADLTHDRE
jgi:PAS domain S-box-containing protein